MTIPVVNNTPATHGVIAWMARNKVSANLLMIFFLAGGLLMFKNITQEVFPDFDLDIVNISVTYPGASPEEIERGIIQAIEEAVQGIEGIDEINSRANEGGGVVSCELLISAERQQVYQDIQQEVARIRTLPEDAEDPVVTLAARRRQVLTLVVFGHQTEQTLRNYAEQIRDELLQATGITQVDLSGIREQEIQVAVSRESLRAHELSLTELARIIRNANVELPAGGIKTAGGELLLRMQDRRDWAGQFAEIPVAGAKNGRPVLLKEIAEVTEGFEDTDKSATYNGQPAVLIDVYRIGDQTPVSVSKATMNVVNDLNKKLPPGINIAVLRDMSTIYRQRAYLLTRNGAIGLALVLILLGAFLEMRLAFWVAMGIPISFLGGLIFMPGWDVTINMISMFAFLIALGIVVDDAIVVGENVYEYIQRGFSLLDAAVAGTREVAMPVVFSILTNIVAFAPLFAVPGIIGKIWRVIPAVVITVFVISLIECLFVLPAHLGHVKRRQLGSIKQSLHNRQQAFSQWFIRQVYSIYKPFLERVLHHRYLTAAIAIAVLILTIAYVFSGRMGMVPMPRVDADFSVVTAALPYGSPVEKTEMIRNRLEKTARELADEIQAADPQGRKQLTGIYSVIGASFRGISGGHVVEVRAYLAEPDLRPVNTKEFTQRWQQKTGPLGGLDGIRFESDRGGPGGGVSLSLQLSHSDNEQLESACRDAAEWLEGFANISDVDIGYSPGKEQFDFAILSSGLNMNLTSEEIARQMRSSFYGAEALRQQRGRNEIKVRVQLPENERTSEEDIDNLLIRTPAGTYIPVYEVATAKRGRSYTRIERRNSRRVLTVTADVNPVGESETMLNKFINEKFPVLKDRYPGLGFSLAGRQQDFREGMDSLRLGFIVAVLMIYVLLAIPFKSYTQPLIIMLSIPFGIVGATFGHLLMGYDLSLMSMMGIIALSGVVVNDSLVLIDYANRNAADEGTNARQAILTAGVRRFRPILLTTLTTFFGLAPMIFERSRQARFMIPMAISLGFGILFATAITLIIVPSFYLITDDVHRFFAREKKKTAL